ncbi:Transposon Ty3-I Gag-Pol polyprotein [Thelohanellus kitauei]|uniref:Transposon Ty3-I Gag-Pol polyprotein n=1 Tax=Thelohanellus kitauei TaxID=669202 RepID=A0A0C2MEV7_THEKT|nr:Transposon Ty3-I Gag-Pol polyprotein [Thelohanellus kitauei]
MIDSIFDSFSNPKYFTTLDLRNDYWEIPLQECDKHKTAFNPALGLGKFEFNVLPFGMANAPASFKCLMNSVLIDLTYCQCYLDDIIVYSDSIESHLQHVNEVLKRLSENGLKLKVLKCAFACTQIKYLGFLISESQIEADLVEIEGLSQCKIPSNIKELQSFLGSCNVYSRFIKNYSHHFTSL